MIEKQKLPFGLWPSPIFPSMLGAKLRLEDAQAELGLVASVRFVAFVRHAEFSRYVAYWAHLVSVRDLKVGKHAAPRGCAFVAREYSAVAASPAWMLS